MGYVLMWWVANYEDHPAKAGDGISMDFNYPAAFPRSFRAEIATCHSSGQTGPAAVPSLLLDHWRCGAEFHGSIAAMGKRKAKKWAGKYIRTLWHIVNEALSNGVSYHMDLFIIFHNPLQTFSNQVRLTHCNNLATKACSMAQIVPRLGMNQRDIFRGSWAGYSHILRPVSYYHEHCWNKHETIDVGQSENQRLQNFSSESPGKCQTLFKLPFSALKTKVSSAARTRSHFSVVQGIVVRYCSRRAHCLIKSLLFRTHRTHRTQHSWFQRTSIFSRQT